MGLFRVSIPEFVFNSGGVGVCTDQLLVFGRECSEVEGVGRVGGGGG